MSDYQLPCSIRPAKISLGSDKTQGKVGIVGCIGTVLCGIFPFRRAPSIFESTGKGARSFAVGRHHSQQCPGAANAESTSPGVEMRSIWERDQSYCGKVRQPAMPSHSNSGVHGNAGLDGPFFLLQEPLAKAKVHSRIEKCTQCHRDGPIVVCRS